MYQGYRILGICISKVHDERNFEFLCALHQSAQKQGYRLFIYQTGSDLYWHTLNEAGEKSIFELIPYSILDALLIFDESFLDKSVIADLCACAAKSNTPVIMLNGKDSPGLNFIFDYQHGFEQLVRHIITDHHVTDLHMIAGRKDEPFSEQRIAAFKRVLAENQLPFQDRMLSYGDYWSGPTQTIVENMISSGQLPGAIVCANDMMAITACAVLQSHGISIPQDILVTGFDGTQEAKYCTPSLTTCGCNCQKAADSLFLAITQPDYSVRTRARYSIPYEMRIGHSCGCEDCTSIPRNTANQLKHARDRFYKYQDDERFLYEMSARVLSDATSDTLIRSLHEYGFDNTCIALNHGCLDVTSNPRMQKQAQSFDDTMELIFRSGSSSTAIFSKNDILPELSPILAHGNPLIFTALNDIDIPLGFFCFYPDMDYDIYCRIPQFVIAVKNLVGNYRNLRYQKYMTHRMEQMYQHDAMTGLYNRSGFYKALDALLSRYPASGLQQYLVASADLDGLKHINDTYGHSEGDYAIITIAKALTELPIQDKLCARFGGDEMVLFAPVLQNNSSYLSFVREEFDRILQDKNRSASKPYPITASIGFCICDSQEFQFDEILKQSDMDLYKAKAHKKDRH